jgi:hypothetical protein
MSLAPADLHMIGQLLDERLALHEKRERGRRRWWLWFWIIVFIVSTVLSGIAGKRLLATMQDRIATEEQAWSEMKLSYQAELARSKTMRAERTEAEKNAGYRSDQSQADYEAGLMRQALQLYNRSIAAQKKISSQDVDDPEAMLQEAEDLTGVMSDSLSTIMQMALRNTDPAHNTTQERRQSVDAASPGAPSHPVDQALRAAQDADPFEEAP